MARKFNLSDPEFLLDPTDMLAAMRAEGPVVELRMPIVGKIFVTTTHAATEQVAKGRDDFFLTGKGAGLNNKGNVALRWWMPKTLKSISHNMLGLDDPEHRRLRKLVDKAFARRGIRDMRPAIAAEASGRAKALGAGTVDVVPGFSRRLPLEVIADLLGIPQADRATFIAYGTTLGEINNPLSIWRMFRNLGHLKRYLEQMIAGMRGTPQPGLIAHLIEAEEGGDRLSEEELVSMVFLLLFAGFETTTNLISGAILALEKSPDQKAWLFEDFDGRIETATEELCRYVSAVGGTKPRVAAHDVDVQGFVIPKGARVMALPVAANHDPDVFDRPNQLRLDRFPNPHLSFSSGSHFCLGLQLARVELQEALRAIYAQWPNLSLSDERLDYAKRPGVRALKSLRLDLRA